MSEYVITEIVDFGNNKMRYYFEDRNFNFDFYIDTFQGVWNDGTIIENCDITDDAMKLINGR